MSGRTEPACLVPAAGCLLGMQWLSRRAPARAGRCVGTEQLDPRSLPSPLPSPPLLPLHPPLPLSLCLLLLLSVFVSVSLSVCLSVCLSHWDAHPIDRLCSLSPEGRQRQRHTGERLEPSVTVGEAKPKGLTLGPAVHAHRPGGGHREAATFCDFWGHDSVTRALQTCFLHEN